MSLEQIRAFLKGSGAVEFEAGNRNDVFKWITGTLCEQEYWKQSKASKGLLQLYVQR